MEVGRIREIVRYPVKSMAGTPAESARLGWHGLEGDRRFAFRQLGDESGFPWLSASRLPKLVVYRPDGCDQGAEESLPTHVRTPAGLRLGLKSAELNGEISALLGSEVELMKLKHGMFDVAAVSVIALSTIAGIGRAAGVELDRRRFRANLVIETDIADIFVEDAWVGGVLVFGDGRAGPCLSVTERDARCIMLNLDPETAEQDPRIMKAVVRLNDNFAGVYATVTRPGLVSVGDRVSLVPETVGVRREAEQR